MTERVGLARAGFGMGAAVGDYDNDGFDDLLITCFGGLALYHNGPDGAGGRRFVEVTDKAGLKDPHWATSAAWGDIDGDGWLDLYVCKYCEVDMAKYPSCIDSHTGELGGCPPSHFAAAPHRLFRNNANGTFTDVTVSSGVGAASPSAGLAVAIVDLDGDGRPDIYVANDMRPAFLFHNQGGGKFEERALLAGCALGPDGTLVAGMCVAVADVDGSGRPSLLVTNFHRKPSVLHLNRGGMRFMDWSMPRGWVGGAWIGWGSSRVLRRRPRWLSRLGGCERARPAGGPKLGGILPSRGTVISRRRKGKFREVTAHAGSSFREPRVARAGDRRLQ